MRATVDGRLIMLLTEINLPEQSDISKIFLRFANLIKLNMLVAQEK